MKNHPHAFSGWVRRGRGRRWERAVTAESYASAWTALLAVRLEGGGERLVVQGDADPNTRRGRG